MEKKKRKRKEKKSVKRRKTYKREVLRFSLSIAWLWISKYEKPFIWSKFSERFIDRFHLKCNPISHSTEKKECFLRECHLSKKTYLDLNAKVQAEENSGNSLYKYESIQVYRRLECNQVWSNGAIEIFFNFTCEKLTTQKNWLIRS